MLVNGPIKDGWRDENVKEALRDALPTIEHAVVIGHGRPFLSVLVTGPVTEAEVAAAFPRQM